ncbi:unnamed protein product [Tetraodon nigroviridis]|uniref:(spotted green pufferfish) hypothetical protein n=1 Tax=Tetraodon nigroviridis TaxID=99883 RepID=Q4SLK3_TETNG|nr:unnamed protein product [Tetraodon nigroviridis]
MAPALWRCPMFRLLLLFCFCLGATEGVKGSMAGGFICHNRVTPLILKGSVRVFFRNSQFFSEDLVLISESSVSDGSHLGKAGVTPRSVVLSDTVFRNDSQQGRLQQTLKCHRKWCHMSDYVCTVPSRSTD